MHALNFAQEVLEKSYQKPVVVDFWAPWCGPCRVLGPVIEQLAEEQNDRWDLVKVNTEEEPEIAQQYQIRSIPNVKLFYKGEPIAEFMGAYPRHAILQWLDENLPDEREGALDEILAELESGQNGRALTQLEAFIAQNPDVSAAKIALARQLVFTDLTKAQSLVQEIAMDDPQYETVADVRQLASFLEHSAGDNPAGSSIQRAQSAFQSVDMETAIQQIIEATTLDKSYAKDLPRKTAIAFFRLLGVQHELTKKYRWRFDMALY